jgi:TorA maturation chaperone TorD
MRDNTPLAVSGQSEMTLTELAQLRQGLYRFFGALFLYPDGERLGDVVLVIDELQDMWEWLATFAFYGSWQRLLPVLQGLAVDKTTGIEKEYVRLFLVNPQAPPYESSIIDPQRQAAGWIAAQLAREYAEMGLASSPSFQEPPDHVAAELEYLAFLCGLEAQSWEKEAPKEGFEVLRRQQSFLGTHLASWFPAFAHQVAKADQEGFYTVITEAAGAFIHHDQDLIALLIKEFQTVVDVASPGLKGGYD